VRKINYNLTTLEEEFSGILHEAFRNSSLTKKLNINFERWITYNEIISQLIDLDYMDFYYEMDNRIKHGECPNEVIKSIINKNNEIKSVMGYHLEVIQHYLDDDFMKKWD
jgi:hypothetical protein